MNGTLSHATNKQIGAEKLDGAFWLFIGCLLSGVLYSVYPNALLGTLTAAVICAYVLVSSPEDCYVFLFGMQFMRAVIPISLGSSLFGFILFAYAVLLVKMLLRGERLYGEYAVLLCLFAVDVLASVAQGALHIGVSINWISSFVYMIYILKSKAKNIDFEKLFTLFLLAQWAVCLVNVLAELRIFGRSLVPDMYGVWIDGYDLFTFGKAYPEIAGGNEIAFNNSLAIALCVMMFPYVKKRSTRIFYVVSSIFLGYCGFMLIARGFYVELVAFLVVYVLASIKDPRRLILSICALALLCVIFYFVAYDAVLVTLERVFNRFGEGNTAREDLLAQSGALLRTDLWVFLFGAGTNYPAAHGFTAHNQYVDAILSLGIFGGLLYLAVIAKTLYSAFRENAVFSVKAVLPLLMLFAYKFISGSVRDVGFYYYMAMTVLFAIYMTGRERDAAISSNDSDTKL